MSDTEPIRIRRATTADHPHVIDVGTDVFAPYGSYRETLGHWLRMPGVSTYVALRGDRFCGALILALLLEPPERVVAEVLAIEVAREDQGTGVGTALLRHTIGLFDRGDRRHRVEVIRLSTAEDNEPALRLFRNQGFRPTDERCGRYEGGQRIVRMSRPL